MAWLKIEDVARETGLTKRAIRYYEEIGLFQPSQRSDSGYRLYTEEDVQELKRVVDIKEVLGFSLQEIQQFLELGKRIEAYRREYSQATDPSVKRQDIKEIREALEQQLEMVEAKMKKMVAFQQEVRNMLTQLQQIEETMEREGEKRGLDDT
jgi:DNA-binding transcriptional MerR regulator